MKPLLAVFALIIGSLAACDNGARPDAGATTAIREFRDKKNSAEVKTISAVAGYQSLVAARIEPRRTPVEIYIIKKPEFPTYYRGDKGYYLSVMLLAVEGELKAAAYTSTGDPNKVAKKTVRNNGVKTYKMSKGSETREGSYSVDRLVIDKTSDSFNDALMYYSVFFNNGIGLHQTASENYGKLGRRASMGCVRLNEAAAKKVFAAVNEYADQNSKGEIYAYSKSTVNILASGAGRLFSEEEILAAISQNFKDEKALRSVVAR